MNLHFNIINTFKRSLNNNAMYLIQNDYPVNFTYTKIFIKTFLKNVLTFFFFFFIKSIYIFQFITLL